jgi:hypothetical protein
MYGSDYGNSPADPSVFNTYDLTDVTSWCKGEKKMFKLIISPDGASGCEVGGEHFETDSKGNCVTKARTWIQKQRIASI